MVSQRMESDLIERKNLFNLSPGAIDIIKVVALIAMIIDHGNSLFLRTPRPEIYALGRMAFPLFTFIWALNVLKHPERLQHRANRMWMWALLTQPVFVLAFHAQYPWYALNILFVFAGVTQLLALMRGGKAGNSLIGLSVLVIMLPLLAPASYGPPGVLLAVTSAIYLAPDGEKYRPYAGIFAVCSLVCLNGITHLASQPAETLLIAVLPTVLFPLAVITLAQNYVPECTRRFMPPRFFYFAYAGHLLLFGALLFLWR